MKKFYSFLITAILMLAIPMGMMGQTRDYEELYTADFTSVATHSYTQNKTFTLNGKDWTASVSQVNNGVFYLGCNQNNAAKGILNNNSTFSAEVTALKAADATYNANFTTAHAYALQFINSYNDVTKVVFNWDGGNNAFQVYLFGDSGSGYVKLASTNYSSSGASVPGSVEWTGDATSFTKFAIVARPGTASSTATNKTLRAASFYIYKTSSGGDTPSISANDLNIAYDATSGSIEYTIQNGTGSVTAEVTDGNWLTLGTVTTSTVPFTCSANDGAERTATVTLSYTGAENKVVTITQAAAPAHYTTIPTLFSGATSTETPVLVTFNGWVVSGVSTDGKNVFVTDNDGNGFVIFNKNAGLGDYYSVNNILTGTAVSCNLVLYKGFAEITGLNASDLTITAGGSVSAANVTMANLAGINTGALLSYDNLTCSVSNNKYYLSDGTTSLQVYNTLYAFGSTLQDGHKYNITGVYQQYDNTKEILPRSAADIVEVQDPVIDANNVTLAYDATSGEIEYTISHPVTGVSLVASLQEGVNWISNIAVGTASVTFTTTANEGNSNRTATVTLSYTGATDKVITITQEHYVNPIATLPFEFDGGYADIEETSGLTQNGIDPSDYASSPKLKFNHTGDYLILHFDGTPGKLTFDIKGNGFSDGTFKVQTSTDGASFSDLESYTSFGTNGNDLYSEEFENLDANVKYIKWIYTEKVNGNVALGNINLAAYVTPTGPIVHVGTLTNVTSVSMWDDNLDDINDGDEVSEGTEVFVSPTPISGYTVSSVTVVDADNHSITVTENSGNWSFYMPNSSVTINATATESSVTPISGDKYVKVTAASDLTDGQYLIVYEGGNVAFNGNLETLDATGNTINVTISNNDEIEVNATTAASEFTIASIANGYSIKSASGYYIGQTSDANGLASSTENAYVNTISFDEGDADIVSGGAHLRYNSASNQTRFRYYKASSYTGQKAIQLYKKVETPTPETYTLTITGYTSNANGWNLIASPVSTTPDQVENMLSNTYDLYRFNAGADLEWENYKQQEGDHYHFGLVTGKGYLYANSTDVDLVFKGTMAEELDDVDNLPYVEGNSTKSLYLAGNSLQTATTFYVYDDNLEKQTVNFLSINGDGNGFITTSANSFTAQEMQGFFVQSAGAGWTLSTTDMEAKSGNVELLDVKVSRNRGSLVDNAIVSFGNAPQMNKFYLFDNTTRVFIPQNGEEMAVVRAEAQGEMPVNFKASENGSYTISINTENVEMGYLHLIDNLTGNDVDLLATPSYTFNAKTDDYASRFRLVFSAGNADSDNFAFVSDGQIILTEQGDAQVYDVMGRMISSHNNVNHITTEGMAAGVYVIRLTNGSETMTQKIVVK